MVLQPLLVEILPPPGSIPPKRDAPSPGSTPRRTRRPAAAPDCAASRDANSRSRDRRGGLPRSVRHRRSPPPCAACARTARPSSSHRCRPGARRAPASTASPPCPCRSRNRRSRPRRISRRPRCSPPRSPAASACGRCASAPLPRRRAWRHSRPAGGGSRASRPAGSTIPAAPRRSATTARRPASARWFIVEK